VSETFNKGRGLPPYLLHIDKYTLGGDIEVELY